MAYATWGRSLATTAPPGSVGDDAIPPAAQPQGLVPSELPRAACPINPRPRDELAFKAACAAAEGDPVKEYDACVIVPGMRAWREGRFMTVTQAKRKRVGDIVGPLVGTYESRREQVMDLRFESAGETEWIFAKLNDPIYCLA